MIDYIKRDSEMEIIDYLRKEGYKRIIAIYPKGYQVVCWFEY